MPPQRKGDQKQMKRVAVDIDERLWERLRRAALKERRPLTEIMRDLLKEWLKNK